MANTVTLRTLLGSGNDKNIIILVNLVSDGSEETDLVVYDNSAFVNDVTKGRLVEAWVSGSDCIARLEWDTTADSPVFSFHPSNNGHYCFESFGGITNPGGAGATGDLLLTTANLDVGDELSLILKICQN